MDKRQTQYQILRIIWDLNGKRNGFQSVLEIIVWCFIYEFQ